MGIFESAEKNDYKWLWFILTFFGSFIPLILRFITSLDFNIPSFDIKDLLFAGLAMNLSNLNLVGSKKFDTKLIIVLFSALFIILIAFALGVFLRNEADKSDVSTFWLKTCSTIFVGLSIYVSYEANNYVFKKA